MKCYGFKRPNGDMYAGTDRAGVAQWSSDENGPLKLWRKFAMKKLLMNHPYLIECDVVTFTISEESIRPITIE